MWITQINSWQELVLGIIVRVFIIMAILPIHEFAHGWMAQKLGDNTAKFMGRLTLNPMAHIDWLGAACIMLIGFGWAKPVPVYAGNLTKLKSRKTSIALVSLAGPMSNLICAFISCILLRALTCFNIGMNAMSWICYAFYFLIYINVTLAIFNLIPIYPLDGSKILGWFLPDSWNDFMQKNGRTISLVFMLIWFTGVLSPVISFLTGGTADGLFSAVNWFFNTVGLRASETGFYGLYIFGLI